jgi:hypothetical protein
VVSPRTINFADLGRGPFGPFPRYPYSARTHRDIRTMVRMVRALVQRSTTGLCSRRLNATTQRHHNTTTPLEAQ